MNKTTWKVLIADDEPVIREGIRDSVDWSSLQMDVKAEAEDGEEALELALEHSVDILLADLNMPIMNGITLIKEIREKLPHCKIVIITGHDEFSYAQEAVRLNVTDYILKPADPDQLKQVLEGVRNELEKTVKQDEYLKMASNQISKNLSILRERFCREWVEGRLKESDILKQLEFLELPLESPKLFAIMQSPEYFANKPLLNDKDKQMFFFSIENIILEILESYIPVIFRDDTGRINLIVWKEVTETLVKKVEEAIKECLKMTVHLYVETIDGNLETIPEVYRLCKEAVDQESVISPVVRRARLFIEGHYTEPSITLEAVAQTLQVSPVYLSRVIKQELGMSFVNLVTNLRIKKAIQLLNSTDLPIVEISEQVGYDTQHYFSTAFKKVMGVSPIKYRKGLVEDK
ncbi:AraC family transcriptional regulator [Bacillus sp. SA1-12]|uniref:response regulator transcription factor n=1 Tax=Bacillus sp. SA1-12 TaxID=1455638 RepID=UPI00062554E6|nr:response regulator [Bacillus sp. SA1-12]KKI94031.1 AraC family transcriptional regulator [Bacillus sp. SA1-12]